MKLTTTSLVEHRSLGAQDILATTVADMQLLAPGICSSYMCACCCCCTCCAAINLGEGIAEELVV